jgi:hypothetical protein
MELRNGNQYWILKLISNNQIGAEGGTKIGEGVSKLLNLTSLDLNLG